MLHLMLACATDDSASDPKDTDGTGDSDACPIGTHDEEGACVSTLGDWESAGTLTSARDHHVSFVHEGADGTWFFALAGTDMDGSGNLVIDRAPVESDGTLGDFEAVGKMPEARIGPAFTPLGDGQYLLAGGLLDTYNSTERTWILTVSDDGSVEFSEGPSLVATRYHAAAAMWEGYVYVSGGMFQTYDGALEQYAVDALDRAYWDGTTLGAFEAVSPMVEATTHHATFAHDAHLYVMGGGDSSKARSEVYAAPIDSSGALGEWTQVGEMLDARGGMAATVLGDQVLVVGGMKRLTGNEVDTVWRGTLSEDATISEFAELAPMPQERAHSHQAPVHGDWIYSAGGSISHMNQDEVYRAQLE